MKNKIDQLLAQLDLDKVTQAILTRDDGEAQLADFDIEDASGLVRMAAEKWLLRDLGEFTVTDIEQEKSMWVPTDKEPFCYVVDLAGTLVGLTSPFSNYPNATFVCDWKTTKNQLSTEWKNRLLKSWQWRLYAAGTGAKLFIYRGLSRQEETKEVIIEVPKENDREVAQFLASLGSTINSLRQGGYTVWPRSMPYSCGAYGRECEFLKDCQEYNMPRGIPYKRLSYSYIEKYLLCPEKARRYALIDAEGGPRESSEESNFGSSVHRGLAELWRQAFNANQ